MLCYISNDGKIVGIASGSASLIQCVVTAVEVVIVVSCMCLRLELIVPCLHLDNEISENHIIVFLLIRIMYFWLSSNRQGADKRDRICIGNTITEMVDLFRDIAR